MTRTESRSARTRSRMTGLRNGPSRSAWRACENAGCLSRSATRVRKRQSPPGRAPCAHRRNAGASRKGPHRRRREIRLAQSAVGSTAREGVWSNVRDTLAGEDPRWRLAMVLGLPASRPPSAVGLPATCIQFRTAVIAASARSRAPRRRSELFDAAPNPYLVLDADLVVCHANRAYLRLTGRSREELLGRYILETFPDTPGRRREMDHRPGRRRHRVDALPLHAGAHPAAEQPGDGDRDPGVRPFPRSGTAERAAAQGARPRT
ncbi:PAS domain-containing protein [Streptomyces sp. NPDC057002]|uniref:PAS domain-containing protein n=1 Tax=Streptomyces sp. NPDC057002 TaxID=3345992 RepID=UPI00363BB202